MKYSMFGLVAFLAVSQPAYASDQGFGYITKIEQTGSRFFIYMDAARTTRPACDCCNRWEIDAGSSGNAEQSMIAIALTTYAARRQIKVFGTGGCSTTDTERINLIQTAN